MKRLLMAASLIAAMPLSGCATTPNTAQRTLTGSALGAGVGALAGAALGGGVFGGAVVGALAGGAIGAAIKPPSARDREYHRDTRGYCYYIDSKGRTVYDRKATC